MQLYVYSLACNLSAILSNYLSILSIFLLQYEINLKFNAQPQPQLQPQLQPQPSFPLEHKSVPPTTILSQGNIPPFLPGSASLVEQLDRRLLLILRDGRHIIGILRSFDHFCNLILEDCVERRMKRSNGARMVYTDVPLG